MALAPFTRPPGGVDRRAARRGVARAGAPSPGDRAPAACARSWNGIPVPVVETMRAPRDLTTTQRDAHFREVDPGEAARWLDDAAAAG